MSETPGARASCKECSCRTDEKPPYCTWLKAEISAGLVDDPGCEGFTAKTLGTIKGKAGTESPHTVTPVKGDDKRVGKPATKPSKTACLKTDKSLIQTALKLKGLRGSVVMEKVCCGKPACRCRSGVKHGPYRYLHFYSNGKVKRRYLSKAVSALLSHSTKELEKMLHETEEILVRDS